MPDIIPASDRSLIAEAVAAGRVRRCPPGAFTPEPKKGRHPHSVRQTAERARRHDRIVRMLAEGKHIIPARLGISPDTLRCDLRDLRKAGRIK